MSALCQFKTDPLPNGFPKTVKIVHVCSLGVLCNAAIYIRTSGTLIILCYGILYICVYMCYGIVLCVTEDDNFTNSLKSFWLAIRQCEHPII